LIEKVFGLLKEMQMKDKLTLDDIGSEYTKVTTVREYHQREEIQGVSIVQLNHFSDDRGALIEIGRLKENGELIAFPGFVVRQVNWSEILPNAIKAGHYHLNQEDVWYIPPLQRLLVGLIDAREGSKTYNVKQRIVLGGGKAQLLYIPRGVIHGAANLWSEPVTLIYFVNQWWTAEPDKTDEYRVPPTVFGEDFWTIHNG